ncbi:MAG: hypothetical protein JNJ54_35530 [Myxococcaceae bacterium]|nr:hypothetical protein [Myxococcaceae bacterium]
MRTHRVAATVVLLLSLEAFTSESHDEIDLEALVKRSSIIALVEPASPPTKKTEIAIAPKGGSREKYPPYERTRHRYVLKELIHNRSGTKLTPGKTLEIDVGDFDTRLTVHQRYYLEGVRKIPIYSYYRPSPRPDGGAATGQIIFLTRSGDGWEFAASGAIEHPAMREAIEALLKDDQ